MTQTIDDILSANGIIFSARMVHWPSKSDSLYDFSSNKNYLIRIDNKPLNIKKSFEFTWDREPSAECVIVNWFIAIAYSIVNFELILSPQGKTIADIKPDPNDMYDMFDDSLASQIKEITFLQSELEEVLADSIPDILEYMSAHKRSDARRSAAFFAQCPKEVIKKLMFDGIGFVRDMAMKHPHAQELRAFL